MLKELIKKINKQNRVNLEYWEDKIWENIDSFQKCFCQGCELSAVWWHSEQMKVDYFLENKTNCENELFSLIPVTDSFYIEDFFDWLNLKSEEKNDNGV